MSILATFLLLLAPVNSDADADVEQEARIEELVHSDLPLWGASDEQTWPKAFSDEDGSFGCSWQIKMGDWKITRYDGREEWIRFQNYGVFHCFTIVSEVVDERDDLTNARNELSYFIELGKRTVQGKELELWAIQAGGRPGSDYLFLSRPTSDENGVPMQLLQTDCNKGQQREGPSLDILMTRYCAINSKREMIRLAERMAHRSSIGTMTLQPDQ